MIAKGEPEDSNNYTLPLEAIKSNDPIRKEQAYEEMIDFLTPILESATRQAEFRDLATECGEYEKRLSEGVEHSWLVQEALTTIYFRIIEGYYDPAKFPVFKAWAITVAENRWREIRRKKKKEEKHEESKGLDELDELGHLNIYTATPEAIAEANELRKEAKNQIEECAKKNDKTKAYLDALKLIVAEGEHPKPQVIAQKLNVPVEQVYVLRKRILRCLKRNSGRKSGCLGGCDGERK